MVKAGGLGGLVAAPLLQGQRTLPRSLPRIKVDQAVAKALSLQQSRNLLVPLLDGQLERGVAIAGLELFVGSLSEEKSDHLALALAA
jgi:hypothetical protein